MSTSAQYVGFTSKLITREYSFLVRKELTETIESPSQFRTGYSILVA